MRVCRILLSILFSTSVLLLGPALVPAQSASACELVSNDAAEVECTGETDEFNASDPSLPEELTIVVTEDATVGRIDGLDGDLLINYGTIYDQQTGGYAWPVRTRGDWTVQLVTVINGETGRIMAKGSSAEEWSLAAGIYLEADEVAVTNEGEILASAVGKTESNAAGIFASGLFIDADNTGTLLVTAGSPSSVDRSGASGMSLNGLQVNATNQGYVLVTALGETRDEAVGVGIYGDESIRFDNTGTIVATAGTPSGTDRAEGYGISLETGDMSDPGDVSLSNAGDILVSASGGSWGEAIGMEVFSGRATVHNAGTLVITAEADASAGKATGFGMSVIGRQVSVSNEGDIVVTATGGVDQYGLQSQAVGIDVRATGAGAAWLSNSGMIDATLNSSEGTAYGVMVGAPTASIHNSGTITARGTGGAEGIGIGIGFSFMSQDPFTSITNSGTIAGDTLAIQGWNDREHVTNSGLLDGGVDLQGGNDELVVTATGVIVGNAGLGEGSDGARVEAGAQLTGILDGGDGNDSLVLTSRSEEESREGRLTATGFEATFVEGGRWTLESSPDGGAMTLGSVVVGSDSELIAGDGGIVVGDFSVTGTLGGSGTIYGDVAVSGKLAPGHSPGTLTVVGNYTHGQEAVFEVEVPSDGASDRLVVQSDPTAPGTGVAELNGGTLLVKPTESGLRPGGPQAILSADVAVIGAFDTVEAAWTAQFLAPQLSYTDQAVLLSIERVLAFADVAQGPNQESVAQVLDEAVGAPGGPFDSVLDFLFSDATEEQARHTYDALSGEVYTTYPSTAVLTMSRFLDSASRGGLLAGTEDDREQWFNAYGRLGEIRRDAEQGTAPASYNFYGLAGGVELVRDSQRELGLLAGTEQTVLRMDERASEERVSGYQLGLYGRWSQGQARLTGTALYGWESFDVTRQIRFGAEEKKAQGEFTAHSAAVDVEGAATYEIAGWRVEPAAGLTWFGFTRPAFEESGAGDVDLLVDGYQAGRLQGRLTLQLTRPAGVGKGDLIPELRLGWLHDFAPPERAVQARLRGMPASSFTVEGARPVEDALVVGGGFELKTAQDLTWKLDYDGQIRKDGTTHTVQLLLNSRF